MHPLLGSPAVPAVVDGGLVHREELHAAEAETVRRVDLEAQGLVGVQSLRQPPAQLGAVLDGRILQVAQVVVECGHGCSPSNAS